MIRRLLTIASWIALIVGMVWTGKTADLAGPPPPPPIPASELPVNENPLESPKLEIEAAASGDVEWRLALEVHGERDATTLNDWLQEGVARPLEIRLDISENDEARPPIVITGEDLSFVASRVELDRARWIVREGSFRVEENRRYDFKTRAEGGDSSRLYERDAVFLLGESVERLPVPVNRPRTPGFVLLSGAIGVFVHLFLLWGRLMIPFRDAVPDEPGLI